MTNQINFILDVNSPNTYQFWASDVNSDDVLNIADVVDCQMYLDFQELLLLLQKQFLLIIHYLRGDIGVQFLKLLSIFQQ